MVRGDFCPEPSRFQSGKSTVPRWASAHHSPARDMVEASGGPCRGPGVSLRFLRVKAKIKKAASGHYTHRRGWETVSGEQGVWPGLEVRGREADSSRQEGVTMGWALCPHFRGLLLRPLPAPLRRGLGCARLTDGEARRSGRSGTLGRTRQPHGRPSPELQLRLGGEPTGPPTKHLLPRKGFLGFVKKRALPEGQQGGPSSRTSGRTIRPSWVHDVDNDFTKPSLLTSFRVETSAEPRRIMRASRSTSSDEALLNLLLRRGF